MPTDTPLTAEEQALIEIVRLLPTESQGELRADLASMAADALTWERHRALSALCQFLVPKPAPVKHLLVAKEKLDAAEATIATLTTRAEQAEARVGDAVRVITQLQQRAQLAEARVAELEAAIAKKKCAWHREHTTGYAQLNTCDDVPCQTVRSVLAIAGGRILRAAMEGQR